MFIIFTSLKLHNSSIATWNHFLPDGSDLSRGVIFGKPRPIRSDEWMVNAGFVLAQYQSGFPDSNELVGNGKSPLIMGLPTMNIISMVKPALWGYYFLDIERAFSWQWNFKIFPLLMATFLFLMLLTKNNFLLSVIGSFWLLLSSAIQWWSLYTEIFTYGFIAVIAFIYILYSGTTRLIVLNGFLFALSAYCFAMILYPAYLVPLAYFLLAVVAGFIFQHKKQVLQTFRSGMSKRILVMGIAFALIGAFIFVFYIETRETIHSISNTVYPGNRFFSGGNFHFARLFTDNLGWFMNDSNFPHAWNDISELSSYLMLSLLPSVLILYDFIRTRKTNLLLLSLVVFQVIVLIWILIGFPSIFARLSLFSNSHPIRSLFVFGAANAICTIIYLAKFKKAVLPDRLIYKMASFAILFFVSYLITRMLNKQASEFFTYFQILIGATIFAVLNWMILHFNEGRFFKYGFCLMCMICVLPNLRINPLCQGLSPVFENELFHAVNDIKHLDPTAGWAVFGQSRTANFLKTTGVRLLNGVQLAPPLRKLRIIDRELRYDSIYNRYAHIEIKSLIDGQDSVQMNLRQNDYYTIWMDPCSPRLDELGISYILFTQEPHPYELRCMTPVNVGQRIYKRHKL